ncbi:hypothetical protein QJQ45_012369 [Haematococcus lacustris]|nr:hypothetical protein QJQ45_012369 [Haematococcus lacustris]
MLAFGPSTALIAPLPHHPSTQCVIARRDAASHASRSRHVLARAGEMPGMNPAMAEAMKRAMSDPKTMSAAECWVAARDRPASASCPVPTPHRPAGRPAGRPASCLLGYPPARPPACVQIAAQLQSTLKQPEVQQQMQQMQASGEGSVTGEGLKAMMGGTGLLQAVMGNPALQARMQELRKDPEFAGFWSELQTGGMQVAALALSGLGRLGWARPGQGFIALMKYYNDPAFLAKLSSKLGDVSGLAAAAAPSAAAAAAPVGPPEVKDLFDAAKYGDTEAVEDFIAIGKDVGMKDKEGRTPLHFAAGAGHVEVAKLLIEEGAPLEECGEEDCRLLPMLGRDGGDKGDEGYGRDMLVMLLLDAGADKSARNANKKAAVDLATADPRNPVSQKPDIVSRLKL